MDPQVVETIKALIAPVLSGGGALGFYLLYRKFEAETRASLREDLKTERETSAALRKELRDAEKESDRLRDRLKGGEPE